MGLTRRSPLKRGKALARTSRLPARRETQRRPAGRKADDVTCIPLCRGHHRQRTDFSGDFKGWDQARMRGFLADAIAATQRAVEAHRSAA